MDTNCTSFPSEIIVLLILSNFMVLSLSIQTQFSFSRLVSPRILVLQVKKIARRQNQDGGKNKKDGDSGSDKTKLKSPTEKKEEDSESDSSFVGNTDQNGERTFYKTKSIQSVIIPLVGWLVGRLVCVVKFVERHTCTILANCKEYLYIISTPNTQRIIRPYTSE